MDLINLDVDVIKVEPETIHEEGSPASHCDEISQYGVVQQKTEDVKCEPGTLADSRFPEINLTTVDVDVIKSEPGIIYEEESPASHCVAILQSEPRMLATDEHAQECGAYSEIDNNHPNTKKESFGYLKNNQHKLR